MSVHYPIIYQGLTVCGQPMGDVPFSIEEEAINCPRCLAELASHEPLRHTLRRRARRFYKGEVRPRVVRFARWAALRLVEAALRR